MTCFRARIRYLALILVSLCIGIGGGFLLSEHRQKTQTTASDNATHFSAEVRERALRAGVEVLSGEKSGTGIVWKREKDGSVLFLTCAHLLDGDEKIIVRAVGQTTGEKAALVGCDDRFDVAVLRISSPQRDYGEGVTICRSRMEYGEEVIACTNPGGEGLMLTCGVIGYPYETRQSDGFATDYHRTDILLAPGASGGGVYDREGELVGMICFREDLPAVSDADTRGRGYALPADTLLHVATDILETKVITDASGIEIFAVKSSLEGAKIVQELAVIRKENDPVFSLLLTGDRIVFASLNGRIISTDHMHELSNALYLLGEGDVLNLTVKRFGSEIYFSFSF